MSRPYTTDEVREPFLDHIRMLVRYWSGLKNVSEEDKLSGLAFSILVLIDGGSGLPAFKVICEADPQRMQIAIEEDTEWYPDDAEITEGVALHELFHKDPK